MSSSLVHDREHYCRGCRNPLRQEDVFCDLGAQPLANGLLREQDLELPEGYYSLRPLVCRQCLLVQLPVCPEPIAIFKPAYPFFSGASWPWAKHCADYADEMIERLGLGATSRVLEIGSNDGTMLRRFRGKGIPAMGVEPCREVAQHALMEGLPTIVDWWGLDLAERLARTQGISTGSSWRANLVIANNVLAHVPEPRDFLAGVAAILAPGGTATFEFPHVGALLQGNQWDQVYHEHRCYFSLASLSNIMFEAGLSLVDAEHLDTHGGSYRVYAQRGRDLPWSERLQKMWSDEEAWGLCKLHTFTDFAAVPPIEKRNALAILADYQDKLVVGYGASAKAAVTCNYLEIGPETIQWIADTTHAKWGKYLPGCRIPIYGHAHLEAHAPDVVVLFAWNWVKVAVENIRKHAPGAKIICLKQPILEDLAI